MPWWSRDSISAPPCRMNREGGKGWGTQPLQNWFSRGAESSPSRAEHCRQSRAGVKASRSIRHIASQHCNAELTFKMNSHPIGSTSDQASISVSFLPTSNICTSNDFLTSEVPYPDCWLFCSLAVIPIRNSGYFRWNPKNAASLVGPPTIRVCTPILSFNHRTD